MNIFRPFLRKFVFVFFDDILVYSPTKALHKQHLTTVLQTLIDYQLFGNATKCDIGMEQVAYLGHVIFAGGVGMDESKVAAMPSWPISQNLKQLSGYLRLMGYYRKFVAGYTHIAKLLTDQL